MQSNLTSRILFRPFPGIFPGASQYCTVKAVEFTAATGRETRKRRCNMSKNSSSGKTEDCIRDHEPDADGVDRRGFLKCMAWAGTGALCVIKGGVLSSYALGAPAKCTPRR